MTAKGRLKADTLVVAKFDIDWLKSLPAIKVVAALTNSATGSTHGWVDSTGVQWSERTKKALQALRESLESDLATAHLEGGGSSSSDSITVDGPAGVQIPDGGLGEHLGTLDATPSV